jgi:hypothetical protein
VFPCVKRRDTNVTLGTATPVPADVGLNPNDRG